MDNDKKKFRKKHNTFIDSIKYISMQFIVAVMLKVNVKRE